MINIKQQTKIIAFINKRISKMSDMKPEIKGVYINDNKLTFTDSFILTEITDLLVGTLPDTGIYDLLTCRKIEGSYPDYKQLLNNKFTEIETLSIKDLKLKIEAMACVIKDNIVKIDQIEYNGYLYNRDFLYWLIDIILLVRDDIEVKVAITEKGMLKIYNDNFTNLLMPIYR